MQVLPLLSLLAIAPTLAFADIEPNCDELWFSRNAMLDDAGYCFASQLGRSIFDNADCTTQSPVVSADVAEQIAVIRELEKNAPYVANGICQVDTTGTILADLSHIALRRRLTFQPATDGGASACIGYRGAPINLHVAPDEASAVLGQIPQGALVSVSHLAWRDWNFTIVHPTEESGLPTVLGWYLGDITADAATTGVSENCAFLAG